ncbi:SRPBCC domain-containing protein [Nocardioides mangrovi]|uniref:SRPBCC domain-containing protein n=1 Tax=Nocardioides mangrovi TaxID=2874580 RepID=A0ABS7UAU2_9ACTN|nr:SRPBCC domain-containing protein [Nocardioides mangrovi]MBZ5737841.1 SRPBCC domain-containing protein [Nocardioides mangrovi]
MEHGSIERELTIDASPEVVYEVISSPEHIREWWPDEADLVPVPGATGTITFGDPGSPDAKVETLTVVDAEPPYRFSFRWAGGLLVTFELVPEGDGTRVRFSESGFRELGWEAAVLEEAYADHVQGWDHFLPRLVTYGADVAVRS